MFNLKTASKEIKKIAKLQEVASGEYELFNAGIPTADLPDEAVVAKVRNGKKEITITAGDIKYIQQYGD